MDQQAARDVILESVFNTALFSKLTTSPSAEQEAGLAALEGSTDIAPGEVWHEVTDGEDVADLRSIGVTGSTWGDVVKVIRSDVADIAAAMDSE